MRSNYKRLGDYIRPVDVRNKDLAIDRLLGVSITKTFIESIANTVGTDFSNYKVVKKNQFAYGPVTSRNGDKISVALLNEEECIISSSYSVFEVNDENQLSPDYLMLWFNRPEFDRYARYMSHGSVREIFSWDDMCDVELPVPSIEEQHEIVAAYKAIENRITLKKKINDNLYAQIQTIYLDVIANDQELTATTIGEITLNVTDGVHNTVFDDPDGKYYLLSCKNIKGGYLSIGSDERMIDSETFQKLRSRTKLEKGDILMSSVGTVGELVLLNIEPTNFEFQRSVAIIKPDTQKVSSEFIFAALTQSKPELIYAAHGAVQQCLFISDISNFPILVPSKGSLELFDRQVSPLFEVISLNEKECASLSDLHDCLLSRLTIS